ncbi:MAG: SDR family oxidoreductase [Bacteroidetes bacterium]|nr:SDR family oxidoreductase [Fibrella sp.]
MKTAIVTGGAQGIGRVTTQYLLTHGYRVAVWEADTEALVELQDAFKPSAKNLLTVPCDVSSDGQVRKATEQTMSHFGRIDALINNAGIGIEKPLDKFTLDDWNRVIGTNLTGTFLCTKHAAPHLTTQQGCVINMASTRAFQSEPDTFAYSASKGGIVALTHSLAVSLGPSIRVNCISPGWIDVSGLRKKTKSKSDDLRTADHQQHPAGRVGQADDIARMILFLLADQNSFITGQNFIVDGGMTSKMIYV